MRLLSRMLAPLAVAGLLVGTLAAPAHANPIFLDEGHVDVLDIDYTGGGLTVGVFADSDTGNPNPGRHDPGDVTFEVPPAAILPIPPSWGICAQGDSWVLPQNEVDGLLWAGWNAGDVASGDVAGNQVTVTLTGVNGPQGSDGFCVFSSSGGSVTQVYVDGDGTPDSFSVNAGSHTHANWAFDVAGVYEVTFEVTAVRASDDTPITTGEHTFTFDVF